MAEQTRFKGKFVRKSKLNQLKGLLKEKTDEDHEKVSETESNFMRLLAHFVISQLSPISVSDEIQTDAVVAELFFLVTLTFSG